MKVKKINLNMKVFVFTISIFFMSCINGGNENINSNGKIDTENSNNTSVKNTFVETNSTDSLKAKNYTLEYDSSTIKNPFIIDTIAVLFFEPNSDEIQKLKERVKNDDEFDQTIMDNEYYQSLIEEYITAKKIKIYTSDSDFFLFKYSNGKDILINRKNLEFKWGAILFNQKKSPLVISGTEDYKTKINKYFGK
jgi:hypothetical protein